MNRRHITLFVLACGAALLVLCTPEAFAQCAMCKTAVAAGGEKASRTMNIAMLVLLVPPVTIFCAVFALVYRHRDPAPEVKRDGRG
jgi:hypothetical protein